MSETRTPKLFIISGPGGAGKTTVVAELMECSRVKKKFIRVITATSRTRRFGEKQGKDYFFLSREEFLKKEKQRFFLETQTVAGNFYGTPAFFYDTAKKSKKDLIMCLDVKGGMYLRKKFTRGKIITIFITAPSKKELFKRMKYRQEQSDVIKKRMALAKQELAYEQFYDYVVINKHLSDTVDAVAAILKAEQYRRV